MRHVKVLKLHILKPADDMPWKELGSILRDVRYRVFRLANLAISESYLNFHKKRTSQTEIPTEKFSQLNKNLMNMILEENAKKGTDGEIRQLAKKGALNGYIYAALSQYKLRISASKWSEILSGRSSLPTFRLGMSIPIVCTKPNHKRLERMPDGSVEIDLMVTLKPYPRVVIATKWNSIGDSQRAILERLLDNTENDEAGYRQRCLEIKEDKRTGKWHLFVTYDFPASEADAKLSDSRIVGIDLGFTCPLYAAIGHGHARLGYRQFSALMARIRSLQNQTMAKRRNIQRGGKLGISGDTARSGHGRDRKLQAINKFEGKINRAYNTLNHQLSSAVIKFALNNGAGIIQMENLDGLKDVLSGTFLGERWKYFELQNFLKYKAKEAGIKIIEVDPKYTSRRCSECGHIDMEFSRAFRDSHKKKEGKTLRFICPVCKYTADPDYNAARNLATADIENIIIGQLKKQGFGLDQNIDNQIDCKKRGRRKRKAS